MSMKATECKCVSCAGPACKCGCQNTEPTGQTRGCACGETCNCAPACSRKVN